MPVRTGARVARPAVGMSAGASGGASASGAAASGLVLLALIAGCAVSPDGAATGGASPPAAEASLESILLPVITERMQQLEVPGLVAVVETAAGESYEVALGVSDVETGKPMEVADHLRVGSITKTMTATVILQLVEEGELGLDDPLAPYFPGVDTNDATVRQALNMTSGIPSYTGDAFMQGQAADPRRVWSPDEVLALVAGLPPTFAAGEGWEYSNTNYTMLGLIAEHVGGAPLGELMDERLFAPLGMTRCSAPPVDTTIPAPGSQGYQWGAYWDGTGEPPPLVDVTDWNISWGFGTGEAICTAPDMLTWAKALVSGELLDPATQAERLQWVPSGHPSVEYGLGISRIGGLVGHNGSVAGFQSQAAVRESDGTAIVVLTNLSISPDLQTPGTAISNAIAEALPPQ